MQLDCELYNKDGHIPLKKVRKLDPKISTFGSNSPLFALKILIETKIATICKNGRPKIRNR